MSIAITISADKPGFMEHLDGLRAEHDATARKLGGAAKEREAGIAQGLALAIEKISQWQLPVEVIDPASLPAQPGSFADRTT